MNARRPKARAARTRSEPFPQPSDYETDHAGTTKLPAPPKRTNEELNLTVLQRHFPQVLSIISISPYAIVYIHSDEQKWVKMELEGTLFVCQLTPSALGAVRYAAIILNRRGMQDFFFEITTPEDVEATGEYLVLQAAEPDGVKIYGIWIFSEPPPSSTAGTREANIAIIKGCAEEAEKSRKAVEEQFPEESVPMGRQLSLRQLFGEQREQDAGWSVHSHPSKPQTPQNDILGQLFKNANRD